MPCSAPLQLLAIFTAPSLPPFPHRPWGAALPRQSWCAVRHDGPHAQQPWGQEVRGWEGRGKLESCVCAWRRFKAQVLGREGGKRGGGRMSELGGTKLVGRAACSVNHPHPDLWDQRRVMVITPVCRRRNDGLRLRADTAPHYSWSCQPTNGHPPPRYSSTPCPTQQHRLRKPRARHLNPLLYPLVRPLETPWGNALGFKEPNRRIVLPPPLPPQPPPTNSSP